MEREAGLLDLNIIESTRIIEKQVGLARGEEENEFSAAQLTMDMLLGAKYILGIGLFSSVLVLLIALWLANNY